METEEEANNYGRLLIESCQISSIVNGLGMDPGTETPETPGFFAEGAKEMHDGRRIVRGTYHGLDVYVQSEDMQFIRNTSNSIYIPYV
ncbi:MAG: hypothetical protein H0W48_01485 [Methylibium sp.]|nr:hypothetical protein [Methylibium sp.]